MNTCMAEIILLSIKLQYVLDTCHGHIAKNALYNSPIPKIITGSVRVNIQISSPKPTNELSETQF